MYLFISVLITSTVELIGRKPFSYNSILYRKGTLFSFIQNVLYSQLKEGRKL